MSIGLAPSKTLAKAANKLAKKDATLGGVFSLTDRPDALDWLARQPEVDARRLAAIGHSVGAAAALLVAARRPALSAIVSLAAFAHPARMMERWLDSKGIPRWPFGQLILWYVQRTIGHRFNDIAPCHTIRQIRCPVLIAHGSDDGSP